MFLGEEEESLSGIKTTWGEEKEEGGEELSLLILPFKAVREEGREREVSQQKKVTFSGLLSLSHSLTFQGQKLGALRNKIPPSQSDSPPFFLPPPPPPLPVKKKDPFGYREVKEDMAQPVLL